MADWEGMLSPFWVARFLRVELFTFLGTVLVDPREVGCDVSCLDPDFSLS